MRYEVACCIRTSDIVWVAGPYLPGVSNDITIFRDGLIHMLEDGERVEADDGYVGECPGKVKVRKNHLTVNEEQGAMRARLGRRQETVNRRIKVFAALNTTFRQSIRKHSICFRCAAILVQMAFELGQQEMFDMREYDDRLTDAQATAIWGV